MSGRKRKMANCSNTLIQENSASVVKTLVKRLRALEQENAELKARVTVSENTVQELAEDFTNGQIYFGQHNLDSARASAQMQLRQQEIQAPVARSVDNQQHSNIFKKPQHLGKFADLESDVPSVSSAPSTPRSVVTATICSGSDTSDHHAHGDSSARHRVNSPRQFYLTLLAMYCSAFAHIVHGPESDLPILTSTEAEYYQHQKYGCKQTQISSCSPSANGSTMMTHFNNQLHGTTSAEVDMRAGRKKYERMLHASSYGLLRLIQFRRKIVQERELNRRRAAAEYKLGIKSTRPQWQ